jgi:hypothetical protein
MVLRDQWLTLAVALFPAAAGDDAGAHRARALRRVAAVVATRCCG